MSAHPTLHVGPTVAAKSKLDHGLALAALGFNIFPLIPNKKTPAILGWQISANANETKIREWAAEHPGCGWGIPTGDRNNWLTVIDIDPRNGGEETWRQLRTVEDFPSTLGVKTAGGGLHLYYRTTDQRLKSRKNSLGPGIDIKSHGGYVVAPGSIVDGRSYEWYKAGKPIADAPPWLVERCSKAMPKSAAAGKRLVEENDAAIKRAEAYLAEAPEAVEGERDDTAFKVAARLYDFGVSKATALDILHGWNEGKCFPPLDDESIERIADSAETNRDRAVGVDNPENASGFEDTTLGLGDKKSDKKDRPKLYYLPFAEAAALAFSAGAEPLIEGLIDIETLSIVYGESGVGKSFQEMDKDFCIAAALPWAGKPVKQGAVVWVAAEGGHGVYKRLQALKQHYEREDVPFFIVPCPVDLLRPNADLKPLIEMIQAIERDHGVKVVKVTVDTLSRVLAGGNENGPEDMGALIKNCDKLRFSCRCHLTLIHHTGLADKSRARGSSLLRAAADTEIEITRGRIRVTKQRDRDETGEWSFRLHPMSLGPDENGKPVSAPWVEILPNGAASPEPMELEPELQMLADEIETRLTERDTFSTKTAIECALTAAFLDRDPSRASAPVEAKEREQVNRALKTMQQKGWIAKLRKGQWKWRGCTNARDE